ncbi:hypothetical protein Hdeb2414_s0136g00808741 [Helianthus debilis subsp. tardiflorus]
MVIVFNFHCNPKKYQNRINKTTNQALKMAIKSVITASSLTGEAFESVDVDFSGSDSDSWQVIDASDSDDGNFSYGDVTTTDDEDDDVVPDVDDLLQHPFGSPLSDVSMQSAVEEIAHRLQVIRFSVLRIC